MLPQGCAGVRAEKSAIRDVEMVALVADHLVLERGAYRPRRIHLKLSERFIDLFRCLNVIEVFSRSFLVQVLFQNMC